MTVCFTVPGKPQGKARPRFTRSGHTYTPGSTAAFDVRYVPKKPDCDNIAKIILDALNGLAYDDDAQVVKLYVEKRYGAFDHVTVVLEGSE